MKRSELHGRLYAFFQRYRFELCIVVIMLMFSLPLLPTGFPVGHDNISQLIRTAARIKAISDGQFPVRWASDLNYGYGHPGFIFFYPLPGYGGYVAHQIGLNLETSYKLFMMITFLLTPLCFFLWAKKIYKPADAFLASLIYGLSPYAFLNAFVRIHLGESLALLFIPLVFLFIEMNSSRISFSHVLSGAFLYSLLIHSHTILSFTFTFVFIGYVIANRPTAPYGRMANFIMLSIGILLSAYFLLPALWENRYINSSLYLHDWYKNHFLNSVNLIYSAWGFGSNVNEPGGLSVQIGPVQSVFALASVMLLGYKNNKKRMLLFWILVFCVGIFLATPASGYVWEHSALLRQYQFPWRFIALCTFAGAALSGYVLSMTSGNRLKYLILIPIMFFAVPMAKFGSIQPSKPDNYYFNHPGTAAYHNEATTIWAAGDAYEYPKQSYEYISGNGTITPIQRNSITHTFEINAGSPSTIKDNTMYFPGWQVFVDNQKTRIEFQNSKFPGIITFDIPTGIHTVRVIFRESPVRLLSNIMTIMTLIGLSVAWLYKKWIGIILK